MISQTNLAAATLLGLPRKGLLNKRLSRFIVNDDIGSYYTFCNQALESNEQQALNLRMLDHDRTPFWAHLEVFPTQDSDGAPILRITLSNITALIEAEAVQRESDRFKQAILNTMSSQIAVLDSNGVIIAVNKSWQRFAADNGIESGIPAPHTQRQ